MWWKIGIVSLGVILSLAFGFFWGSQRLPLVPGAPAIDTTGWPRFSSGLQGKDFFEPSFNGVTPQKVDSWTALVPHHLVEVRAMAELFSSLKDQPVERVVILSPNHFSRGREALQSAVGVWETPYGDLLTDQKLVEDLADQVSGVSLEEETLRLEHGVGAVTPFVKRQWPEATLIPIVIHESLTSDQRLALSDWLADLPAKTLVLASVDMSHTAPEKVAQVHDEITSEYLAHGCDPMEFSVAADAPWVLWTLCTYNQIQGTQKYVQMYRGSSVSLGLTTTAEDNTSHLVGYFLPGPPSTTTYASLHVVGDIMLDRGTRKLINEKDDPSYPWQKMDWFLTGSHLRVGNLEGTVNERPSKFTYNPPFEFVFDPSYVQEMLPYIDAVSLANNHASDVGSAGELETGRWLDSMSLPHFGSYRSPAHPYETNIGGLEVSLIGYHQFQPNIKTLEEEIQKAKAAGRFVIVIPHWGQEYIQAPGSDQRALAKIMVEAGADLIVGGHPHVAQGVEMVDGVPVVYSLGNFVFDQQIPATWEAMTTILQITDERIIIDLLPIYTKGSQPVAMSDARAQDFLQRLAKFSTPDLQTQVQNGRLIIPRN